MIANPAIPHPFTLNDLRVHSTISEEPSSTSALTLAGVALAVVLAIAAYSWPAPLRWFTPTEANPPAPAFVPSAEPARPIERQEIIAPLTPVPATKSVEAPIAPAPVVQAPHVPAPVVRPRAATLKPESRGNPIDKTNTTVRQATPIEKASPPVLLNKAEEKLAPPVLLTRPAEMLSPPVLLTKPEEKTEAPIIRKLGDDARNAPKPAATNDPAPVTE